MDAEVATLLADVAKLGNYGDMKYSDVMNLMKSSSERIKKTKNDLETLINKYITYIENVRQAENTIVNLDNKMNNDKLAVDKNNDKQVVKQADKQSDKQGNKPKLDWTEPVIKAVEESKAPEVNAWTQRLIAKPINQVSQYVYRATPIENSIFNAFAIHVDLPQSVISTPRLHNNLCYVSDLKMFVFYNERIGYLQGNGLKCNPQSNDEYALQKTVMCNLRSKCKREQCNFAHNPCDLNTPPDLCLIASPYYNSHQHNTRYAKSNKPVITSIPYLDVFNLDVELRSMTYDSRYRFGSILLNFILISCIITEKSGPQYML